MALERLGVVRRLIAEELPRLRALLVGVGEDREVEVADLVAQVAEQRPVGLAQLQPPATASRSQERTTAAGISWRSVARP